MGSRKEGREEGRMMMREAVRGEVITSDIRERGLEGDEGEVKGGRNRRKVNECLKMI